MHPDKADQAPRSMLLATPYRGTDEGTVGPKLCECGCGQPTKIADRTRPTRGGVKGQPYRFIWGHNVAYGPRTARYGTVEERFWKRVEKTDGCWLWRGQLKSDGYGKFHTKPPHRLSWELANGRPIPEGLEIHHDCRVRNCVNPAHLRVVTHEENMRLRDIAAGPYPPEKLATHCYLGHPYAGENLYVSPSGQRYCLTCTRRHQREYNRRRRAKQRLEMTQPAVSPAGHVDRETRSLTFS